ncbi:MAG: flagellar export chaperone FliS [Oxalobacteraceae bacterium]|nr:MAG: flagellar export chaperone FliS [Oxalobacteraceae bacterium]
MQRNISAYQQSHVRTSSRGELLIALYDGAIRYATAAKEAIERRDYAAKGHALSGVMGILQELAGTLHHHEQPELCRNLKHLYTYFMERLQTAGMQMESAPVVEVLGQLQGLRSTWSQAVAVARQQGYKV